jgi:hypothetical protein
MAQISFLDIYELAIIVLMEGGLDSKLQHLGTCKVS